jgi:DNA-directed RNA polymerase specialized sigma24 family protein
MDRKDSLSIPDEVLANQYAAGHTESFQVLFERYKNRLYDYALKYLSDSDLAEDIT